LIPQWIKLNWRNTKTFSQGDDIEISIKTTDGKNINLKTKNEKRKDERGDEVEILIASPEDYDSNTKTYPEAISKSMTILSYRKLMKIYDIQTDEDFYDLFVRNIMAYYLIPPKKEKTLIQELEELERLKKYYKKFNASPYKLLLLDDVVIGLNMSLRLPLLEILQKDFDDEYQIIMTTFDEN